MTSIKKGYRNNIFKIFSLTALSTLVRMGTGLISVKVVSLLIGPHGIALLGQLNNFSTIAMSLASGGINNGITKYVAEYKESKNKIHFFISTALHITIWCSILSGLLLIIFNKFLSKYVLLDSQYGFVFVIFGFTISFYALNMFFSSILNGYKEFTKYVLVNIAGSVFGLIFTLILVLKWALVGALVSAVTFQSVMLIITIYFLRKVSWMTWDNFKQRYSRVIAKKYFKYTFMAIVSALTIPISQLLIRTYIISEISTIEAGWWEGMNRLSNMYLMVITSSFGVYYLPRLSEIKQKNILRTEIFNAYKIILPILFFGFITIYILRFFIIKLLFTEDFIPMEMLFKWQLCGDFFKISSWLLAFIMIAKSMVKAFIMTEVLFSIFFVLLGVVFVNINGLVGVTQAYMLNYFIYLIAMFLLFKNKVFFI